MDDPFYDQYPNGSLDPQARLFLTAIAAAGLPPLHELTPELARKRNIVQAFSIKPIPVSLVKNEQISGSLRSIPVRCYFPEGDGPFPAMIYFHGGGWMVGTLDDFDPVCRYICRNANIAVVAVDYQLAPEGKFPTAIEEGYTVLNWLSENGISWNIDPAKLIVGGDSSGGNIAAVLCLMAKDRNGPMPVFQWLICPATDLLHMDTASYHSFGHGMWVPVDLMNWYIDHYLNDLKEKADPYVSPFLAGDLSGLPPAFVVLAEFDLLHDEGIAYAKKLKQAGVEVSWKCYPGQIHDFVIFGRIMKKAVQALEDGCNEIRRILN
jgi:acetyl esterase